MLDLGMGNIGLGMNKLEVRRPFVLGNMEGMISESKRSLEPFIFTVAPSTWNNIFNANQTKI